MYRIRCCQGSAGRAGGEVVMVWLPLQISRHDGAAQATFISRLTDFL